MKFLSSTNIFIHVDCDSFFVACELLRNPHLKGKYVCVGGDIIVASSYEAKALGIKTGTPIWEAKRMLKNQGHYFGVDIDFYTKISHLLMGYLKEHTLYVEPFSIDEAFCDITGLPKLYKMDVYDFVKKIQQDILEEIGVPVSIGVSNTRIRAKIFSKLNKPYGICVGFEKPYLQDLFQSIAIKDIPFVGKSSQEKLHYRCTSIYDYLQLGFWEIKKILGKTGTDLWLELLGVNMFVVKKSLGVKSISATRSFNHTMSSKKDFLWNQIFKNIERAFLRLYDGDYQLKEVVIMLRSKDFKRYYAQYKFTQCSNNRKEIYDASLQCFHELYDPDIIYRSTGVFFYGLTSYLPRQMNLFETHLRGADNHYQLNKQMYQINKKLGKYKVAFGDQMLNKNKEYNYKIRF